MSIVQVSLLGVIGVLFVVQLKQEKTEYSIYLCLALGVVIFLSILDEMKVLVNALQSISESISINVSYIATLIKMLGITYLSEFSTGICKDAGCQALAMQIEVFGKVSIFVLSLPILLALLQTIQEFWI